MNQSMISLSCMITGVFVFLIFYPLLALGETFTIGASLDISGPTGYTGNIYSKGIQDYCRYVNDTKLLKNHKVNCLLKDDGYKNELSIKNFKELMNENMLVFLSYATGANIMLKKDIETIGIPTIPASLFSGIIKDTKYFFLPIATYAEQLVALSEHISSRHTGKGVPKVGAFIHPSAFGHRPIAILKKAIAAGVNIDLIEVIDHKKGLNYAETIKRFNQLKVQYIISQSIQTPVAKLLKEAHRRNLTASTFGEPDKITFLGASYTGGNDLINLAGAASEGFYWVTSYQLTSVKSDGQAFVLDLAQRYQRNDQMANSHNYVAGILVAQIAVEGIRRSLSNRNTVTRQSIQTELNRMWGKRRFSPNTTVGVITFSPKDHSGVDKLQIYCVKNGQFLPVRRPFRSAVFRKIRF